MPVRDEVQNEVSKMRNMEIKTTIEKDTTLNFPVWQENRTRKGFLMHVTAVPNAIKKCGHFEDCNKAVWKYKEASTKPSRPPGLVCLYWRSLRESKQGKQKEAERKDQGK